MSDEPPPKMRPTWNAVTSVDPKLAMPGSTLCGVLAFRIGEGVGAKLRNPRGGGGGGGGIDSEAKNLHRSPAAEAGPDVSAETAAIQTRRMRVTPLSFVNRAVASHPTRAGSAPSVAA